MDHTYFAAWGKHSIRLSQKFMGFRDMQDIEQHRISGAAIWTATPISQKVSLLSHDV
jgi:hypothetical protein